MLKHKIKSLNKSLQGIVKGKASGVFFVDLLDDQYIVKKAGEGEKIVFQGNEVEFEKYHKEHEESVFIIMDIPRECENISITDCVN